MARRALILVAVAAAVLAVAPPASAACARFASEHGNDRAAGTARAPFRTIHKLLAALPSGAVGCLAPGSTFHERVWILRPAMLTPSRGRATVVGGIVVGQKARGTTVRHLAVRGSGRGRAAIDVRGDAARILGNDVSGPGFLDRNAACILLDGVRGGIVDGNTVHGCTRATRHDLSAPGISVASAFRSRISNNVVFHTVGDGIALGPNAQRTRVQRNIVDGNLSGIFFGGGERTASSYNVVTRNIVSNSGRFSVHSSWPGPVGRGNIVSSNCLWNGFGSAYGGAGFSHAGNVMSSPRYRNRPRDFTLGNGPCAPMHPSIVAIRLGRLPQFSVAYRLRALPRRVQVVALTLKGLWPRAKVTLRCTAGCGTRWVGRPPRASYTLPVLRGAWLKRGAVIEVREHKDGWVGQAARIVVTGLPGGVRVDHWSG